MELKNKETIINEIVDNSSNRISSSTDWWNYDPINKYVNGVLADIQDNIPELAAKYGLTEKELKKIISQNAGYVRDRASENYFNK